MKILVMGLPGAGKTYLASRMAKLSGSAYFNADEIRRSANDWDFTDQGRIRQSLRMKNVADFEKSHGRNVICDFVCPTENTRKMFDPDLIIWLNTISSGRFEDTNKLFENPSNPRYVVTDFLNDEQIEMLTKEIFNV